MYKYIYIRINTYTCLIFLISLNASLYDLYFLYTFTMRKCLAYRTQAHFTHEHTYQRLRCIHVCACACVCTRVFL